MLFQQTEQAFYTELKQIGLVWEGQYVGVCSHEVSQTNVVSQVSELNSQQVKVCWSHTQYILHSLRKICCFRLRDGLLKRMYNDDQRDSNASSLIPISHHYIFIQKLPVEVTSHRVIYETLLLSHLQSRLVLENRIFVPPKLIFT